MDQQHHTNNSHNDERKMSMDFEDEGTRSLVGSSLEAGPTGISETRDEKKFPLQLGAFVEREHIVLQKFTQNEFEGTLILHQKLYASEAQNADYRGVIVLQNLQLRKFALDNIQLKKERDEHARENVQLKQEKVEDAQKLRERDARIKLMLDALNSLQSPTTHSSPQPRVKRSPQIGQRKIAFSAKDVRKVEALMSSFVKFLRKHHAELPCAQVLNDEVKEYVMKKCEQRPEKAYEKEMMLKLIISNTEFVHLFASH